MENPFEKQAMESNEDRLSQYINMHLHVILSSAYTNDFLRTRLVSKRWRELWSSMPYLRVDDRFFSPKKERQSFKGFVTAFLLSRNQSDDVHSFRVGWFHNFDPSIFSTWILYMVKHKIRLLEIYAGECEEERLVFPGLFFSCQSLEEFTLVCAGPEKFSPPKFANLSHLRRLHLSNCLLGGLVQQLINPCPVLEELGLRDCTFDCGSISSNELKSLTIQNCHVHGSGHAIHVKCPSLEELHYVNNEMVGRGPRSIHVLILGNQSSIRNASVVADEEGKEIRTHMDILGELATAQKIELLCQEAENITENQLLKLPTFVNLKRLTLGKWEKSNNFDNSEDFHLVAHLLQKSPNLEMLTLKGKQEMQSSECIYLDCEEAQKSGLPTSCPHLKNVQIEINGCGVEGARDLMKHLLPNSKVLKIRTKPHGSRNC